MSSVIVSIDHEEAKVFHLDGDSPVPFRVHRHGGKGHHRHPKDAHPLDTHSLAFFHEVVAALKDATEVLLVGPGQGKIEFQHYLQTHFANGIGKHIVAVQTIDHPSDKELVAHGHRFFEGLRRTGLPVR